METSAENAQNFSHSAINLIKSNPVSNISKFLIDSILNASSSNSQQNLAFFNQFQNNLSQEFILNGSVSNCKQYNHADYISPAKNSWASTSSLSHSGANSEEDQRINADNKLFFPNPQNPATTTTNTDFTNLPFGTSTLNSLFSENRNEFSETPSNLRCHQVTSTSAANQIEASDDVTKFQQQMLSRFGGSEATSCLVDNTNNSTNDSSFLNLIPSTTQPGRPSSDPVTSVQTSLATQGLSTSSTSSMANLSLVSYLQQATALNPILMNQSSHFAGLQSVHAVMAAENYNRLLAMAAEQNQGMHSLISKVLIGLIKA